MKDVRQAGAIFSADGAHRYSLTRGCSFVPAGRRVPGPLVLWLMLNPSTANEDTDDATIRKIRTVTQRWCPLASPFGGFMVGNAYSFRATNPRTLAKRDVSELRGPGWASRLEEMVDACAAVIAAWGVNAREEDARSLLELVRRRTRSQGLFALSLTMAGWPAHPLYIPLRIQPRLWTCAYGTWRGQ